MTAVEWLKEMLTEYKYLNKDADHYFEQALEMEKEQTIGAYLQAKMENLNMENTMGYYDILEQNKIKAEQHYTETYEKQNSSRMVKRKTSIFIFR